MRDTFSIAFSDERVEDEGILSQFLRLKLGEFEEGEWADLTIWSVEDYERQWRFELEQTLGARGKGALILSIHDQNQASRVWTWTMWKQDEMVHFQNRLMFMLAAETNFDPARVYEYIGEHKLENEDGQLISDWTICVSAINEFLIQKANTKEAPCSIPA